MQCWEDAEMPENERLSRILNEVAAEEGMTVVKAGYRKFAGASYHSHSLNGRYRFEITDYVSTAPDDVLRDYLETMVSNVRRKENKRPVKFMEWTATDEFINRWRPVRIRRSRNISRSTVGRFRDLGASLDRLMEIGLVHESDIRNSYYTWTSRPNHRKVGECNLMFRIVTVSSALDSEEVPEKVLDYVVYHETVHLRMGHCPGRTPHGRDFKELETLYPDVEWCEKYLSEYLRKR